MRGTRRRTVDVVTADRPEQGRAPVIDAKAIDASAIDDARDARRLTDAAVLDLLESSPAHEPPASSDGHSEDSGAQQSRDELAAAATRASMATALGTTAALILIVTIAFASVASRAPGLARILFLLYVVVSPFAVASVIREEASLKKARNTPSPQSPDCT